MRFLLHKNWRKFPVPSLRRRSAAMTKSSLPKHEKQVSVPMRHRDLFSRIYKRSGIHGCRKIPDIYSFVTMGMIMGLRLVVL